MSFLRSLSVFFLSLIFTSTVFIAITSYALSSSIQKQPIKSFLSSEGNKFIDQQCGDECSLYEGNQTVCLQDCRVYMANQTEFIVDNAVDEVYKQNFFGISMNEASASASSYFAYVVIGIVSGILLLVASKSPFSTMGKNLISTSVALFILVAAILAVVMIANPPLDLGKDFIGYLSSGLSQVIEYGIILLVAGIVLVAINHAASRKKIKPDKKKK